MTYSEKLKALLRDYSNQKQLAAELNVSSKNLSDWINCTCTPTLKNRLLIDDLYNVKINPLKQIKIECV